MNDPVGTNLQAIIDLAGARLNNPPLDPNAAHDLREILRLAKEALVYWTSGPDAQPEPGGA